MRTKVICMLLMGAVALSLMGCGEDEQAADTEQGGKADTQVSQDTAEGKEAGAPAEQRDLYVQGIEQTLKNIEQKVTAWQQQADAESDAARQQKMQELGKQVQTSLADARSAVDKVKAAAEAQWQDAKVDADQAIQDTQAAFKKLQSYMDTQVTQAQ